MEIRKAGTVADVAAAEHLFDHPVRPEWAERFLTTAGHHLLLAYEEGAVAGFVSGVETWHPDKGAEMFLYELAVGEPYRRRGIGRALVLRLAALARGGAATAWWRRRRERRRPRRVSQCGRQGRRDVHRGDVGLLRRYAWTCSVWTSSGRETSQRVSRRGRR